MAWGKQASRTFDNIVDLEGGKQTTHLGKALAVAAALWLRVTIQQPGATQ